MSVRSVIFSLALFPGILAAQGAGIAHATPLKSPTTLPIVFTSAARANRSHSGDVVFARTRQSIRLANGVLAPRGTKITGHVVAAATSTLSIHFDSIEIAGQQVPLHVTVRAMATPMASWDARKAGPSDMDMDATVTQIGGDLLTPSQTAVRNLDGDIVATNDRDGVHAHLIANGRCDGSNVAVAVDIFSASACGLYGFTNVTATEYGSSATPSTLTLVSSRTTPQIWKHSTALLEVIPETPSH